ncbi:hypothetical protein Cni_G14740 [Canna indica]|uniref:Uncharacterized protein n=1 Tax=Canna indica TaxID=4628 RepID=A0AAQ3KFN8_9LILI|nr:hypothetical protein Cni_G14740 [Canna indica]
MQNLTWAIKQVLPTTLSLLLTSTVLPLFFLSYSLSPILSCKRQLRHFYSNHSGIYQPRPFVVHPRDHLHQAATTAALADRVASPLPPPRRHIELHEISLRKPTPRSEPRIGSLTRSTVDTNLFLGWC